MRGSWASSPTRRRASTAARPPTRARRSRRWSSSPARGRASAGSRPPAGRAWCRARWRRGPARCTASTSRRRWSSSRGARPPASTTRRSPSATRPRWTTPTAATTARSPASRSTTCRCRRGWSRRWRAWCARAARSCSPTTCSTRTRPPPPGRRSSSACATPRTGSRSRWSGCGRSAPRPGWSSSARRSSRWRSTSTEWLERGSGYAVARPLLERLLAAPPASAERFAIRDGALVMTWWAARFRRPGGPSPD